MGSVRTTAEALRAVQSTGTQPPNRGSGQTVATIRRGAGLELRVDIQDWDGRPQVGLRIWHHDNERGWFPDRRRGLSVRASELADLLEGLEAAAKIVTERLTLRGEGNE